MTAFPQEHLSLLQITIFDDLEMPVFAEESKVNEIHKKYSNRARISTLPRVIEPGIFCFVFT